MAIKGSLIVSYGGSLVLRLLCHADDEGVTVVQTKFVKRLYSSIFLASMLIGPGPK